MISKLITGPFSLLTLLNLQTWCNDNLITPFLSKEYLETFEMPTYSALDVTHVKITTTNGNESYLNDLTKKVFFVEAGTYPTVWELTADGTESEKRMIVLDNGNDTHTGKLPTNERAYVKLYLNNASHWIVDRMSWMDSDAELYLLKNGSSFNVLSRLFTSNTGSSVPIHHGCHNNTVQECRFENMSHGARITDQVAILLIGYSLDLVEVFNTKIIYNEIVNANDGIQTVKSTRSSDGALQDNNYEGTFIYGNHISINSDIYSDGNGNYTSSGIYAVAEDGIDLKSGSDNPINPVTIKNNHIWGYRRTDSTDHLSGSSGDGIGIHYGVKNTLIEDNVFFDCAEGVIAGDNNRFPYSFSESTVKRNLFHECGGFANATILSYSIAMADNNDSLEIEDNVIVNARQNAIRIWSTSNSTVINNISINPAISGIDTSGTYPNTNVTLTPNTEFTTSEATALGYTSDYVFTTDNYTNSPRVITLENCLAV